MLNVADDASTSTNAEGADHSGTLVIDGIEEEEEEEGTKEGETGTSAMLVVAAGLCICTDEPGGGASA